MSARALLAAAVLLVSVQAEAMDYSLGPRDEDRFIYATGEIFQGDAKRFTKFLDALPAVETKTFIVFNSQGGLITEALEIAKTIEARRFITGVAAGAQCSSACVLAWAAGYHKYARHETCIGVHNAVVDPPPAPPVALSSKAWKMARANLESTANLTMATWLWDHGAPVSVTGKLFDTPSNKLECLTPEELEAWQVRIVQ
jgi:hypothetical protein